MKSMNTNDKKRLDNDFCYHAPTSEQIPKYQGLRAAFKNLATEIVETCPDSRERSTALTHLETAMFWANASIARNGPKTLVEVFNEK